MGKTGVMVCGHGSRDIEAIKEFEELTYALAGQFSDQIVGHGFLEFAQPTLQEGLDSLREKGVDRVFAVPGMLFAGGHVKNDVPSILNEYAARHSNMTIQFSRELGLDTKLLQAAADRITKAEKDASNSISREETLLMVVGRGSSDSDVNNNIKEICRMLKESMGFNQGEICFSGIASPLVEPGLEQAVKLGCRQIIVFPYFLYNGVLVKKIYSITDRIAKKFPDIEFLKAKYLGNHLKVVETFADRIRDLAEDLC